MKARPKQRKRSALIGGFVAHRKEMRESPAWVALSDAGRRVLDRVELEHMRHGGGENGSLIVTYADFTAALVRRSSISRALRECQALGFLKVQTFGYRKNKLLNPPSRYTLTYVNGCGTSPPPTDDWRSVATMDDAAKRVEATEAAAETERVAKVPRNEPAPPLARYGAMGARSAHVGAGLGEAASALVRNAARSRDVTREL